MTNPIDPISYNAAIEAAKKLLLDRAQEQRDTNEKYPQHAKAYPSWVDRVYLYERAAEEVELLHRTEPQTAPDDEAKRSRAWPHDEPNGWNLNAARFVELLQSQPMMWLRLTRAKYIEMRIDTRDGGFNLYDRDRLPLEPDEVVAAINEATEKYGAGLYRPRVAAPAGAERLALADDIQKRIDLYIDAIGTSNAPMCKAALEQFLWDSKRDIVSSLRAGGWREDMENGRHGFIVSSADETRFRFWDAMGPTWTTNRVRALRFARRIDAERFAAEDEDAWKILEVVPSAPKNTDKEG